LCDPVEVTARFLQRCDYATAQRHMHRERPADQRQQNHNADDPERGHTRVDGIERRAARRIAELREVMQLGQIAVLERLRRLVEKRLNVVCVQKLRQFRERAMQLLVALGEGCGTGAVFVARFRGAHERVERLLGGRQLLARMLNDFGRLRAAAHHARTGPGQVDAGVHQMLRGFVDCIHLLERDVRKVANVVMGTRERPETETYRDKLENAECGQDTQQAGCDLDLAEHREHLKAENDGEYLRVNGSTILCLRSKTPKIALRRVYVGQRLHSYRGKQQCGADISDSP